MKRGRKKRGSGDAVGDSLESALRSTFKNAIFKASDPVWHTDFLRTGIAPLDWILGGGFARGRIIEIFGPWSSGKTMILYHALAQNQQEVSHKGKKGLSILFEAEGAFDPRFFSMMGGNPDELMLYPVTTVEAVFDGIIEVCALVRKMMVDDNRAVVIGWDSIAATSTRHAQEVGMAKRDMSKSGAMSTGTSLITTPCSKARVTVIATNQVRQKIGSKDSATHTPGGDAWPFHSSQRLEIQYSGGTKTSSIFSEEGGQEIGKWVRMKVIKNKCATPFGRCALPIYVTTDAKHPEYNSQLEIGVDKAEALFNCYTRKRFLLPGEKPVIIVHDSGWYEVSPSLGGSKKFRYADWPEILDRNPALWNLIYEALEEKVHAVRNGAQEHPPAVQESIPEPELPSEPQPAAMGVEGGAPSEISGN